MEGSEVQKQGRALISSIGELGVELHLHPPIGPSGQGADACKNQVRHLLGDHWPGIDDACLGTRNSRFASRWSRYVASQSETRTHEVGTPVDAAAQHADRSWLHGGRLAVPTSRTAGWACRSSSTIFEALGLSETILEIPIVL